jgi:hypothetical protein
MPIGQPLISSETLHIVTVTVAYSEAGVPAFMRALLLQSDAAA